MTPSSNSEARKRAAEPTVLVELEVSLAQAFIAGRIQARGLVEHAVHRALNARLEEIR